MRSAAAFGIDTLILSADCADVYQPKTVRAAMGALFRLNILICSDLPETVKVLRECDRRVLAAELREGAESLTDISLSPRDIVIIGNEGHGISHELSCACSMSIYIPISSMTESLNAAVAASVFLWEMRNRL